MVFTLLSFLILLSLVVISHELGHFLVAKLAGVRVEEFGLGFPPRAVRLLKRGETEYTLNWLPFGAFVKVAGEDLPEADEAQGGGADPRSFQSQSSLVKAAILAAGVVMNFVLGVVLIGVVVGKLGEPHLRQVAEVIEVREASPAQTAGLAKESLVTAYGLSEGDLTEVKSSEEFVAFVQQHAGEEIILAVEDSLVLLTPRKSPPEGEGALGIVFGVRPDVFYTPVSLWQVPRVAVRESFNLVGLLVNGFREMVRDLVVSKILPRDIAGPVGIARITGQVAREGIYQFLSFGALLSINLAVINILPLPALDGGRLVFVLAEAVAGRKLKPHLQRWIHTIGIAFLIFLMLLITFYDIVREF